MNRLKFTTLYCHRPINQRPNQHNCVIKSSINKFSEKDANNKDVQKSNETGRNITIHYGTFKLSLLTLYMASFECNECTGIWMWHFLLSEKQFDDLHGQWTFDTYCIDGILSSCTISLGLVSLRIVFSKKFTFRISLAVM